MMSFVTVQPPGRMVSRNRSMYSSFRPGMARRIMITDYPASEKGASLVSTPTLAANGIDDHRVHHPVPVFENSPTFRMACRQLESVAEASDIDKGVLERLSKPKRALVVS